MVQQKELLYDAERGNITIALAGDCMITRRMSVFREKRFLSLAERLRGADVVFANMETVVHSYNEGAGNVSHGTYMTTEPALLDEIKWLGVNLVSCANNHAFNYGETGIQATVRHLDEAKIAHAGSGGNLAEAREPAYLDTPGGRVALIAATAFFNEWEAAEDQRVDMVGRAGVNPLGFEKSFVLDKSSLQALRRVGELLGLDVEKERRRNFGAHGLIPVDTKEQIDFFGQKFVLGESPCVRTVCDEQDALQNLKSIREARRQADWVIFSLHNHELGGAALLTAKQRRELEEPADFVKSFARRCIDEGADVFVGHGPHFSLGIELYKGKPIFYSLGNFIYQSGSLRRLPAFAYKRFGLGLEATASDFADARWGRDDSKGNPGNPLTEDEFKAKFMDMAERVLGTEQGEELYARARDLPQVDDVADLAPLFSPK